MKNASHSEQRQPRIVVAGSINMDLVYRVSRLPQPGETLTGYSFQQIHGGKGANQAVAAARMSARVTMIGRVGDDAFGAELVAGLQCEAIDVSQIRTSPRTSSGLAVIGVEDSGQNCITVVPGANGQLTVDDILAAEAVIAAADVILLQLEIPVESVMAVTRIAKRHNVPAILDPAPAPAEFPMELLQVDVVCPNESEAALITGLPVTNPAEAEVACRALQSLGAKVAIITMGSRGCVLCEASGHVHHIPAYAVTTIDTTAAGDAFAGALGYCLALGQSVHEAAYFASAAGALASTRPGAQPAMPQLADVAALRRLK